MPGVQIDNFIKGHCNGSIERFTELLCLINRGYDLEQLGRTYNISASNLSRRLSMFTCVTFKKDVWDYLALKNEVNQRTVARAERVIDNGRKIVGFIPHQAV